MARTKHESQAVEDDNGDGNEAFLLACNQASWTAKGRQRSATEHISCFA